MDNMDFVPLNGYRRSSELVYSRCEKMLFRRTRMRSNEKEYVCYQNVLSEKKSKQHPKCNARLKMRYGRYTRNGTDHSNHMDHKNIYQELKLLNRIKKSCEESGANLASHKVSTKEIFNRELARYFGALQQQKKNNSDCAHFVSYVFQIQE